MPHYRFPSDEISRRGKEIYDTVLRERVETEETIGKQFAIDIETGEYEIDEEGLRASLSMLKRKPNAVLYGARIGYDAVYAIGGTIRRTSGR